VVPAKEAFSGSVIQRPRSSRWFRSSVARPTHGGCRWGDYWRMGLPLEVLIVLVARPTILVVWPLYPNVQAMSSTSAPGWNLIGSALLGLGMLGAGWLIGHGFQQGRQAEHYVTVKGLAETFVQADLAIWPLRYTATGDDLNQVQATIDADAAEISSFLVRQGLTAEEIQPQRVEVTDLLAQAYRPEGAAESRFIVAQTILVRTEQVDLVAGLNRATGELVSRGVVLVDTGGPTYLFTGLNDIKPQMLADASANAREAAAQFAADVDSSLVGIRRASQGIFEILPRDPAPGIGEAGQIDKKVRVVSTIEYLLGP
jgi:uncharacterized protein